jgi:DNA-binding transcriptional LysR family regulator
MEQLAEMMAFAKVVELKSFSAAARAMHTSKSLVSKQVSSLESALGVRLLTRTTRSMSLTEIGAAYYQHCARIADELEAARETASLLQVEPRGVLKITAPIVFASMHLAGAIADFLERYPQVEIELDTSDRVLDLVDEGYDLALRITSNPALATVSRKIVDLRWATCASPDYLARRGEPQTPQELAGHNCIYNHVLGSTARNWPFRSGKETVIVTANGNCRANSTEVMHRLALRGVGVILFPTYVVGKDLAEGRLKEILPDYTAFPDFALYATYMPNRYMQAKVRVFIDHLLDYFGKTSRWESGR